MNLSPQKQEIIGILHSKKKVEIQLRFYTPYPQHKRARSLKGSHDCGGTLQAVKYTPRSDRALSHVGLGRSWSPNYGSLPNKRKKKTDSNAHQQQAAAAELITTIKHFFIGRFFFAHVTWSVDRVDHVKG